MRLRRANEQQEETLWRVFLMFVVIALVIIRAGFLCRGELAVALEEGWQDARPGTGRRPSSTSQADLYRAALVVLNLAAAAGRRFVLTAGTLWDLMNRPLCHPRREPLFIAADLCECRVQRLDMS